MKYVIGVTEPVGAGLPAMLMAQFYILALGPDRQFIAIRVGEMQAAAAREGEFGAGDGASGLEDGLSGKGQVVGVQNDQRATGAYRFASGKAAAQAPIAELAVGGAKVGEGPAKHGTIKGFAACDVMDVEFDVVDSVVAVVSGHGHLLMRLKYR